MRPSPHPNRLLEDHARPFGFALALTAAMIVLSALLGLVQAVASGVAGVAIFFWLCPPHLLEPGRWS